MKPKNQNREFPDPKSILGGFKEVERFQFRGQWGIFRKVGQITIATELAENDDTSMLLVKTEARTVGFIKAQLRCKSPTRGLCHPLCL